MRKKLFAVYLPALLTAFAIIVSRWIYFYSALISLAACLTLVAFLNFRFRKSGFAGAAGNFASTFLITFTAFLLAGYPGTYMGSYVATVQAKSYLEKLILWAEEYKEKNGLYPKRQRDLPDFGMRPYLLRYDETSSLCQVVYDGTICDVVFYHGQNTSYYLEFSYRTGIEDSAHWMYDPETSMWRCWGSCHGYDPAFWYDEVLKNPEIIRRWYDDIISRDRKKSRQGMAAFELSLATCLAKSNPKIHEVLSTLDWDKLFKSIEGDGYLIGRYFKIQDKMKDSKCSAGEFITGDPFL